MENNSVLNSLLDEREISLLNDEKSPLDSLVEQYQSNENIMEESLLDQENISIDSAYSELDPEEEKRRRRAYFLNPEVQAEIVLDNYLRNRGYVVSGKERRKLRREFLRDAKKGKFRKMFLDIIKDAEKEDEQSQPIS